MPQKHEFVRKHVFINRKLQGRYMLTFLIPMLIMLGFWLGSLFLSADKIMGTTLTLVKRDLEDKIALGLQDKSNPTAAEYRAVLDDIQSYLRAFSNNRRFMGEVVSTLLWVFGIGLFLVIIQIVLLTIFFSHRLAGPIYRLEKACHTVIDGDYTEQIRLRKHDEMQNLARLFNEVVTASRSRLMALRDAAGEEQRRKAADSLRLSIDSGR